MRNGAVMQFKHDYSCVNVQMHIVAHPGLIKKKQNSLKIIYNNSNNIEVSKRTLNDTNIPN